MSISFKIANQFYAAFQNLDAETMNSFYSKDAQFSDPAFGELNHEDLTAMWAMLCASQKETNFRLEFEILETSDNYAKVYWQAWYTFSKTGRKVHNQITAQLTIQNGKITEHHDHFNLYNWAKQALGFSGWLMGWSNFFQRKLQTQTKSLLKRFQAQEKTKLS